MKKVIMLLLIGIGAVLIVTGCQDSKSEITKSEEVEIQTEDYVYQKYDVEVEDKVKLGEQEAENTIMLSI